MIDKLNDGIEFVCVDDDKGLMVTDKKLALTVCSKWVLIE